MYEVSGGERRLDVKEYCVAHDAGKGRKRTTLSRGKEEKFAPEFL